MEGIGAPESTGQGRFELLCGIVITLFAALLAVTDLGAGRFGDDELISYNEKANAYQWFNSKGIKQTLVEGQRDLLQSLLDAKTINPANEEAMKKYVTHLEQDIDKYKKEKKEILLGSAKIGQENWVQDVDGQLGKVVGAKEWESKNQILGQSGDIFDYASLFLQISLVIGAISIVVQSKRMKYAFFTMMCCSGITGVIFSVFAFRIAFSV